MEPTWTTKDKEVIAISQLSNTHLINIIAYCIRDTSRIKKLLVAGLEMEALDAWSFSASTGGDMASYYSEQAGDQIGNLALRIRNEKDHLIVRNEMVPLVEEALKRKLAMPVLYQMYGDKWITIDEIMNES
jgi:hypothetical protein